VSSQLTLDQSNTIHNNNRTLGSIGGATTQLGQNFTSGITGKLSTIALLLNSSTAGATYELKIFKGADFSGETIRTHNFSTSTNFSGELVINFPSVQVEAGLIYTFSIRRTNNANTISLRYSTSNPYSSGNVVRNTSQNINEQNTADDLYFKTFVVPSLPATHLNFDGSNDYILLSNEASFDFTYQMTVEFWMKSGFTPEQWDALVAKGDDSWRIALTAQGKINFAGNGGFNDVTSNATLTDGNWHHVAVTYNGNNAIIYVDGILDNSSAGTGSIDNSSFSVSIGENLQAAGRHYKGEMEEVRIWNTARTANQISANRNCELQGTEPGLIAYFKFNQGLAEASNTSITSLTNSVSSGAVGTLQNFTLSGASSNWLAGSPVATGIALPLAPTAAAQTFCGSKTVADLIPTPSASIKWYTVATGGIALTSTTSLSSGIYYVSAVNSNGCESARTSVVVTTQSVVPSAPTVITPVVYNLGDTAIPVTATLGANGTALVWYTTATGESSLSETPTPTTAVSGLTSYWVSSMNANGCESERIEIVVVILAPATHLNFDGVNDYVSIPSGINVSNSSFTVEFMAKRTATNVNNYVLKQGNQANNNLLHIGFRDNNNFTFAFWYNDIDIPVTNYIADSEWHHWSCVYNSTNGTRQVYQDGVLVGSDSSVVPYTGSGIIQIGSFDGTSYFFNGGIDDFRIWNVARTADQINASKNCELQSNETGLVAYYNFNQGLNLADNTTETVAFDATGLNNGALTNFALTGATSNWQAGSPIHALPAAPTVITPVVYNLGDTAIPVTATLGANGTALVWYTTATGESSLSETPTPTTAVSGLTSYWVSSTNANGCESSRKEIVVNVLPPCATTATWDGTAWSPTNPDSTSQVIFTGDYSGPGFEACSVVVTGTAEVVIASDETVFIANTITVGPDAHFEILNNTNLIQLIGKPNTGSIILNRNSTPMVHLDYTAWSSPVTGQNLLNFSPQTLANRFYTYNPAATNGAAAWTSVPNVSSTNFTPATGYMIRAANNASPTVAAVHAGVFTGVPNNGTMSTAVQAGTNLVGNPYPSAIDLDVFIENNSPIGVSTLYFYSHAVPQNTAYTAQSNYASYTTAGGVAAISGGAQPDGILQIGQGFFMDVATQGNATFSNAQRLGTSNGQFFKNATTSNEKSRYWLNLKSEVTYYNQMLVAYMDGATNGVDSGIDGKLYSNAASYLSSLINEEAYVIQGRNGYFESTDEVPLAFTANSNGVFTIGLDAYDGLFENQAIYLWDKQLNVIHNIKDTDYTFTTAAGTFDDRFSVVYENAALATPTFDTQPLLVYLDANDYIQVVNNNQLITEVQIYDLTGRLLYANRNVEKNQTAVLNTFGNQMILVKTILENGTIHTTKIIK
jgi:hypothetical protein